MQDYYPMQGYTDITSDENGVTQRFLPWILIALAGAALLLIRRRRKNRI